VTAAFAHFWRVDGDKITSVQQITDSALWQQALQQ
jgi:ketosteroid isomerase-like protein